MRSFLHAVCALPVALALMASPALAVVIVVDERNLSVTGTLGESGSGFIYSGGTGSGTGTYATITSQEFVGGTYLLEFASPAWDLLDPSSYSELHLSGVRHYHYTFPDPAYNYGNTDGYEEVFDLRTSPEIRRTSTGFSYQFSMPWLIDEHYPDGSHYDEFYTRTARLQLGFVEDAAGQPFSLTISAVPEPQTWSLLIIGFGLLGAALRRRQVATFHSPVGIRAPAQSPA